MNHLFCKYLKHAIYALASNMFVPVGWESPQAGMKWQLCGLWEVMKVCAVCPSSIHCSSSSSHWQREKGIDLFRVILGGKCDSTAKTMFYPRGPVNEYLKSLSHRKYWFWRATEAATNIFFYSYAVPIIKYLLYIFRIPRNVGKVTS